MKKTKIGVIGCGNISNIYLENMTENYVNIEVAACADMFFEKAEQAKMKYGLPKAVTVEELLADPEIEIVVNLTIPAVHYQINKQILEAGKHVYCEKPMALSVEEAKELVTLANSKNLRIGNAPDTFLGPGLQTCRKLLDEGKIGEVTGFTANLVSPGHESWHPAPDFYYKKGAGPMLDMGPYYITALVSLFGPIEEISCYGKTSFPQRRVGDRMVDVEVLTHYVGMIKFANGIIGNINMSFDVWNSELPLIEVYGTGGMMSVPDPNTFGGPVKVILAKDIMEKVSVCLDIETKLGTLYGGGLKPLVRTEELAYRSGIADESESRNLRGLGVAEMAESICENRQQRTNGEMVCHVVEALCAFNIAVSEGKPYRMTTTCERPEPLKDAEKYFRKS